MPLLCPFDDLQSRITKIHSAFKSISNTSVFQGFYDGGICKTHDQYKVAFDYLRTDPNDKAVILDLNVRRGENECMWQTVSEHLEALALRLSLNFAKPKEDTSGGTRSKGTLYVPQDDGATDDIPDRALDGIALIQGILENSCRPQVLVVVSSNQIGYFNYLKKVLDKYIGTHGYHNIVFMASTVVADDSECALTLVKAVDRAWRVKFARFHDDPWTNNLVQKWIEQYRVIHGTPVEEGKSFCHHNHIQSRDMLAAYAELIGRMFDVDSAPFEQDPDGMKAILSIANLPANIHGDNWQQKWNAFGVPDWKYVSMSCVESLLKAIGFRNLVWDSQLIELRFPVMPALPFLISLRALLLTKGTDDTAIIDDMKPTELVGCNKVGPFALRVPLRIDGFEIAKRWVVKRDTGTLDNGLCGVIWHALRAKTIIKAATEETSLDEKEKALLDGQNRLLSLFEGCPFPIVGVTFAPRSINLYWL